MDLINLEKKKSLGEKNDQKKKPKRKTRKRVSEAARPLCPDTEIKGDRGRVERDRSWGGKEKGEGPKKGRGEKRLAEKNHFKIKTRGQTSKGYVRKREI